MGCSASTDAQSPATRQNDKDKYPKSPQQKQHRPPPPRQEQRPSPQPSAPPGQPVPQNRYDPVSNTEANANPSETASEVKETPNAENEEARKASLDKNTLMQYVDYEKRINQLEAQDVCGSLKIKWQQLKGMDDEIKRLAAQHLSCKEKRLKESIDVENMKQDSVRNFFQDQASYDAQLSKEQEEYLEALNIEDIAFMELEKAKQSKESLQAEVNELHQSAEILQKLYTEQEKVLGQIFNGKYGSEDEFRLESEQDLAQERHGRILGAKQRWQSARLLMGHAYQQLAFVVHRWQYIVRIPVQGNVRQEQRKRNMQMRYHVATEVRNYLIAVCTNMHNAQRYLQNIEFPYCKESEIQTLERATANVYTDIQTADRHQHAGHVFSATYQRTFALLQWFDAVVDKTINKDLGAASKELLAKKKELRMERVRLLKDKLVELVGPDEAEAMQLDMDGNLTDSLELERQLASVTEPDKVSMAGELPSNDEKEEKENGDTGEAPLEVGSDKPPDENGGEVGTPDEPKPLPLNELAPPPSQEDLFGDISELKEQHEKNMAEFRQAQELNKARMDQGLEEKLAARRTRKARKKIQEQEMQQLLAETV